MLAVSGMRFPIAVLVYWLTTNTWSMGQQFFILRKCLRCCRQRERVPCVRQDGGAAEAELYGSGAPPPPPAAPRHQEAAASDAETASDADAAEAERAQPGRESADRRRRTAAPARSGANGAVQDRGGKRKRHGTHRQPAVQAGSTRGNNAAGGKAQGQRTYERAGRR